MTKTRLYYILKGLETLNNTRQSRRQTTLLPKNKPWADCLNPRGRSEDRHDVLHVSNPLGFFSAVIGKLLKGATKMPNNTEAKMNDLFERSDGAGVIQPGENITTYNFNGAPIRVVKDDSGEPWFVAKDVCDVLEIKNSRDTLNKCLEDDEKRLDNIYTPFGEQSVATVSEAGLYSLVLRSRKPEARAFKRWVTHEVLPSIRREGGYIHATPEDTPEVIMAKALKVADATMKRQQEQLREAREKLEQAAPKVAFVDTFCASSGNMLVRDFAKQVSQSLGLRGFGQSEMFEWLKKEGYMNLNRYPSQRATDMRLLHVTEGVHMHNDGSTGLHHCSRVTPKGQAYFYEKIRSQYNANGRWW